MQSINKPGGWSIYVVRLLTRIATILTAFIIAVFSVNILAVMEVQAAPGNNGSLKVHEKGTPVGTESNDPKVCKFNFEGFGFDRNQSGVIVVATQPGGVSSLTVPFGPANAVGYDGTEYINDGGLLLANGQYKATLYGKDTNNLPNLNDEKAKSKVFKVVCPGQPSVVMQPPQCIQRGGINGRAVGTITNTDDDTNAAVLYTITAKHQTNPFVSRTDVRLVADGQSANFDFNLLIEGNYTVTVTGNDGTSAQTTFAITVCNTPVTPTAPTTTDFCGVANDTYTIPAKTGVVYQVNGIPTGAGTYSGTGTVNITGVATDGYVINGTSSWTFTFSNTPCVINVTPAAPSKVELCGTANDTYTIPAKTGVTYYVNGTATTAGTYNGTGLVVILAVADPGYKITGDALWGFAFSSFPCIITVVPTAPTKTDVCARTNDTYTIPATEGVTYYVNGHEKAAGTYKTQVPVLIKALPNFGYAFDLQSPFIWFFTYTNVKCAEPCHAATTLKFFGGNQWDGQEACTPVEIVTDEPTQTDLCGVAKDSYTIPATTGVIYSVNGTPTVAGTYTGSGTVIVTAEAVDGYVLAIGTSTEWTFEFTNEKCPEVPVGGMGGIGATPAVIVAKAQPEAVAELPQTGPATIMQIVTMVLLAITTYGAVYFMQNRFDFQPKK